MRLSILTGVLLLAAGAASAADDMKPPRIATAEVDWAAALKELGHSPATPHPAHVRPISPRPAGPALARLNAEMGKRFPSIAASAVPVLIPFDADALIRDKAAGKPTDNDTRYLSGFEASKFFDPGGAGYDTAFLLRTVDIPEFADIKFADPIEVQISGSRLTYDLEAVTRIEVAPAPVPALETEFPGIRRMILEHHLRYAFERYGVTYVVSIACFDAGVSRYKMPTCKSADRVALRFLHALRIAGGTPQPASAAAPLRIERPSEPSNVFTYYGPGRLVPNSGFHGDAGRADATAYSQIRFPLADAPAYANTQMFQRSVPTPANAYPWRDNFCERRGFPVGQCPAGLGHQGQDIRAAPCALAPRSERCEQPRDIVAVRDGSIWRSARQEAAYLAVNTDSEHIRFRYLHMSPREMDADNLLSGRRVRMGELIGHVGNFSNRENGTSYHLHFDAQAFTKDGWVFVNPYMTLVSAYERLIHGRGEEITEPSQLASTDPSITGGTSLRDESSGNKRSRHGRHHVHHQKAHGRHRVARR